MKVIKVNNRAYLRAEQQWLPKEPPQIIGTGAEKKSKTRLRFKPRTIWPFLTWGVTLFLGFRILLIPLTEGVYNLVIKSQELNALKAQHQKMSKQLADMKKARDYMKTLAYVEEESHKAGFIKINESPMMVIQTTGKEPENQRKRNVVIEN